MPIPHNYIMNVMTADIMNTDIETELFLLWYLRSYHTHNRGRHRDRYTVKNIPICGYWSERPIHIRFIQGYRHSPYQLTNELYTSLYFYLFLRQRSVNKVCLIGYELWYSNITLKSRNCLFLAFYPFKIMVFKLASNFIEI